MHPLSINKTLLAQKMPPHKWSANLRELVDLNSKKKIKEKYDNQF